MKNYLLLSVNNIKYSLHVVDNIILPFSHLSLQEPASIGAELGGPVSSFTYDEVPESEYTSSNGMSSQQPPLEEPSILSPLLPSSSLPAETDDNSYDIPVPPLIGSKFTPYFDLATGTTHQVAPALPSVQLHTETSDFSPEDRSDDTQYEEEHQCTSCPDMCLPANCMARVQAFGITGVQYFCELDENCRRALAARTRRRAWIALNKQGQDMIKSSNKRIKLLEVGDNVRIPIPSSEVSPCGSNQLLAPTDVPDVQLSVGTAARQEVLQNEKSDSQSFRVSYLTEGCSQ